MSWRSRLRQASFRGVPFHVEDVAGESGRRLVVHEFPKRDTPYAEDMGRAARRYTVHGYVIGANFDIGRTALVAVCEMDGPGLLVHPSLGEVMVRCEFIGHVERRTEGGFAQIDMVFVEAGGAAGPSAIISAGAAVLSAATGLAQAAAAALDGDLR